MRQLQIAKQITNRDSASLDKYLSEVSKEKLISAEEEVELAQRIKQGDQEALASLVKANLRFAVSVAKQYHGRGMGLSDLINEGNLGLIKAAQRFDETRGFKFISYAVWWIRQCIVQAIAENSRIVRLPLNKIGAINKVYRALEKLEHESERKPTVDEIAIELETSFDEVDQILKISAHSVSFDAPFSEDDDNGLLSIMSNPNSPKADSELTKQSLNIEITRALETLSEREHAIISMYFGINRTVMTLEEIGSYFGLTRERVRQIKEVALKKLRKKSSIGLLKDFLG